MRQWPQERQGTGHRRARFESGLAGSEFLLAGAQFLLAEPPERTDSLRTVSRLARREGFDDRNHCESSAGSIAG
jgi:hypothetical protein